jgi:hypothetical protein
MQFPKPLMAKDSWSLGLMRDVPADGQTIVGDCTREVVGSKWAPRSPIVGQGGTRGRDFSAFLLLRVFTKVSGK